MKKVVVKKNRYVDSVSLMSVSDRVTVLPGVSNVEAQMGTHANLELLNLLGALEDVQDLGVPGPLLQEGALRVTE